MRARDGKKSELMAVGNSSRDGVARRSVANEKMRAYGLGRGRGDREGREGWTRAAFTR